MVKSWCTLILDGQEFDSSKILSLAFHDEAGTKSDSINVQLLPNVPRPKPNTKVKLSFSNSKGEILKCGTFYVQSVTRNNNKALSFTATGVEFNQEQKKKRSEHYKDTKLSSIVKIVGDRLGHKIKFMTEEQNIKSLYQTEETDINFLDRVAKKYDVLFSIKDETIFFVSKSSDSLPIYTIDASKCASSSVKHSNKTFYKSCEVSYYDRKKAKTIKVVVDDGQPMLQVKCSCKDDAEARAKAKANLTKSKRGTVVGSLDTLGQVIYAGTRLDLTNTYKKEDDGIYAIERVLHSYSVTGGWTVDVEFENF